LIPDSTESWAQATQQFQQSMADGWKNAFQAFQNMDLGGLPSAVPGMPEAPTPPRIQFSPEKLKELQQQYLKEASELWNQSVAGTPAVKDRRFSAEAWSKNPMAAFSAATYLLNSRALMGLAEAVESDEKTRNRIRFAVEQWMAASAPSNFLAMNADAQKKAIDTQGESIAKGMQNLLNDIRLGHVSMTDESLFEVGRNVATTEGAIVFENELFQLIEYKPLTAKVYERPFLLVPPCINKFYILDLQPENSVIRYAVAQGHRTFVVSWRNPDASLAGKTWDDYIEDAAIKAIHTVQEITGAPTINTLGFCVGGTILSTALAVLAARVASQARRERDAADHAAGLHGHRHPRHLHRRELRQVPRDADGQGRPAQAGRNWPRRSVSCGRTTWSGTTWWATISRARHAPAVRLAVLERRFDQPAWPDVLLVPPHTPTSRTSSRSLGDSPSAARSSTSVRSRRPHSFMPRAKTTSCPGRRPTRRPASCVGRAPSCWVHRATSPASSTRRRRTSAVTG
jgi:hypothetical protein